MEENNELNELTCRLPELDFPIETEEERLKKKDFENKCKTIYRLLLKSDINKIISDMIDMYDNKGVFYDCHNAENILKYSLTNISEVLSLVETMSLEETKEWEKDYEETSAKFLLLESKEEFRESSLLHARGRIFSYILDTLQEKAKKIRSNRVNIRLNKGMHVDFEDCKYAIPFNDHVEFYKDGGWGLATTKGMVEIANNIVTQPSKCNYANYVSFNPSLRIVQSRDNNKFGVISLDTFEVIIPLEYKKIEDFRDTYGHPMCSLLKVQNDNGWGCLSEEGYKLIECKYDGFELDGDLIECFRDGGYVQDEELKPNVGQVFYDGKRDLYNKTGAFIIGGYSWREQAYSGVYYFYFGTSFENFSVKVSDAFDRYELELCRYRINYDDSVCLLLDGNLNSVVKSDSKSFHYPRGKCIESIQELVSIVPEQLLFHNEVDFWSGHFIFQKQRLGEKTIVKESKTIKTYQPHTRPATKEEKELSLLFNDKEMEEVKEDYVYSEVTEEVLHEDDRVIITGLSKDNDIIWSSIVNELGRLKSNRIPAYRRGITVGFYSENGLENASYVAITYKDGKYYVAKQEFEKEIEETTTKNLNYLGEIICKGEKDAFKDGRLLFIRYYEYSDGHLTRMSDDWKVFNPAKLDWFPDTYKTTYHIYDKDGASDYYDYEPDRDPEYTDEDAWEAMTDGMYGDYPGSGWDSESFGC